MDNWLININDESKRQWIDIKCWEKITANLKVYIYQKYEIALRNREQQKG